ncbi:hypothetical protein VQ02_30210 [Methylobacterium variabile]|uniref:Uncharacterized protein n=1 Tax=Methylobacterium variabile TaxID=298794 RepID=A0A0J6USW2_9HYPH|nr:hypothetical protein VQ02_30210 [Methylobacterium variabile]
MQVCGGATGSQHMHRIALAILLSVAGIGSTRAAPAKPWTPDLCATLAKDFTEALGFPVTATVGAPKAVADDAPAGTACLFSAKATGIRHDFGDAEGRLRRIVKDWKDLPGVAADGPGSTLQGYRKGDRRIIFGLTHEPPEGTCEDEPVGSCEVPLERWQWTFKATAYRK